MIVIIFVQLLAKQADLIVRMWLHRGECNSEIEAWDVMGCEDGDKNLLR